MLPHKGIYILIAVGAVMMFVGFLGCYGAIQESQCLLGTVRSRAGRGVGHGSAGGSTRSLRRDPLALLEVGSLRGLGTSPFGCLAWS